ncbi:MAG: sigma 54-interacting transcriptional regulator [Clostridiales Family XIII bacterium]|nr:sigma 54-interacting transcriptional regulator [Clostridiales Family XIII bacterium]
MKYGEITAPLEDAAVSDTGAPARSEDDPVDLRDFERAETLLVTDAAGRPVGVARERTATRAILERLIERLTAVARRTEPLGGEHYAANRIFYRDVYRNASDLLDLVNAIAENSAKLLKILKFSADSIFVADGKGDTIFVNDAFVKPSAAEKSEYINARAGEFERRGHITPAITPMIIREGKSLTVLQHVVNKFGRTMQWITTGVPIFDENGALELIVTNAKNVEEYEQLKRYLEKTRDGAFVRPALQSGAEIVCFGGRMRDVIDMAEKAAETDCTVLITGESGTGKGLLARHIHACSARRNKSLVEVNCGSIPETLFESEFFGYESGAFTGANTGGKAGLLEAAHGGTLLLDEIGDMALPLQAKLLKVLQDKRVTRVGGIKEIEVDVRIIAATNHPIADLIKTGAFRADLYWRLNLFPIHIAPLRERRDDIPALIDHFLRLFNAKHGKRTRFADALTEAMRTWPWPGNVRQLEYFVERMVILRDGELGPDDVPDGALRDAGPPSDRRDAAVSVHGIMPLRDALDETERQLFLLAAESGRSSYEIAEILGTSQTNAYRKIKKYLAQSGNRKGYARDVSLFELNKSL